VQVDFLSMNLFTHASNKTYEARNADMKKSVGDWLEYRMNREDHATIKSTWEAWAIANSDCGGGGGGGGGGACLADVVLTPTLLLRAKDYVLQTEHESIRKWITYEL